MSEKLDTFLPADYPGVLLRVKNGMAEVGFNVLFFTKENQEWWAGVIEECACMSHQIQAWEWGYIEEIL